MTVSLFARLTYKRSTSMGHKRMLPKFACMNMVGITNAQKHRKTSIIIDSFSKKFLSETLLLRSSACVLHFSILLKRTWIANEYEIPMLLKWIYRYGNFNIVSKFIIELINSTVCKWLYFRFVA